MVCSIHALIPSRDTLCEEGQGAAAFDSLVACMDGHIQDYIRTASLRDTFMVSCCV